MTAGILAELLLAAQQNRAADTQRLAGPLMTKLRKEPGIDNPWFTDQKVITTLLNAFFAGLPAGRVPGESAAPEDMGLRDELLLSHPKAMQWRMDNIKATPAGRAFLRMMPLLAKRIPASKSFGAFTSFGIHNRSMAHLCAATLSHSEGQQAVRQAAYEAQWTYSQKFWERPLPYVPRIIVGSGPTGLALAHSLLEAGDVGNTLIVSAGEWAGGPFTWGKFQVNHRNRPVDPDYRAAPATVGTLDGFGPGLVAPNDLSGTWAYNESTALAVSAAMNALSAGPIITAGLLNWKPNPLASTTTVCLLDPKTGDQVFVETDQLVLAPGLGDVRSLPGSATSLSIKELLQHPSIHQLGDKIMVVGENDTACIAIEEILNVWNRPGAARTEHQLREIIWVRPSGLTYKETFGLGGVRKRYDGRLADFLPRLTDPAYPATIRVIPGRVINTINVGDGAAVTIESLEDDKTVRKRTIPFVGTIVNATGFKNPFADRWSSPTDGVFYQGGFPVGRQLGPNVTIVGPGAGIPVSDFELTLFPILNEPSLARVNPVALFRNNLAAELLGRGRAFVGQRRESSLKKLVPRRSPGRTPNGESTRFVAKLQVPNLSTVVDGDLETMFRLSLATYVERVRNIPSDDSIILYVCGAGEGGPYVFGFDIPELVVSDVLQPMMEDQRLQWMLAHQYLTRHQVAVEMADLVGDQSPQTTLDIRIPVTNGRLEANKVTIV